MRAEDLDAICGCELFAGVAPAETARLLGAMDARVESYEPNDLAVRLGDEIGSAGIVLAGVVAGEFLDNAGKVTTVMRFGAGALFAEAMAVLDMPSMVEVRACRRAVSHGSTSVGFPTRLSWTRGTRPRMRRSTR